MLCMVPLFHSYLPFTNVLLPTCIASTQPHSIYCTAQSPLYIQLSSSITNTAWSVRCILTYLNDDTSCILLNLNLLDFPLSLGSLRVSTLLLSACSFVNLCPWNSLRNWSLPGVVAEAPDILHSWRRPSRNPYPSLFKSTFASAWVTRNSTHT